MMKVVGPDSSGLHLDHAPALSGDAFEDIHPNQDSPATERCFKDGWDLGIANQPVGFFERCAQVVMT
jgi:hypothetical protein